MPAERRTASIESLLQKSKWAAARKQIDVELAVDPNNHWLMTQKGVTLYEQHHYREALELFQESLKIVPDCPLTLWNLAGTLDALGKPASAIPIFTWLLDSKKSPEDDDCWESQEWTDSLKTDCVFRIAVCLQHLDRLPEAETCYRQYINLLLNGSPGSYPIEDAVRQIHPPPTTAKRDRARKQSRQALETALQQSGLLPRVRPGAKPPKIEFEKLFA